jgi:hypothetical protein
MDLITVLTVVLVLLTVILVVVGLAALLPAFGIWLSSRRQMRKPESAGPRPHIIRSTDYGPLLFEEHFRSHEIDWSLPATSRIEKSQLLLPQGTGASPRPPVQFSDFIFETKFKHIEPDGLAEISLYIRYQTPPCPERNCSIQIWASGDWKTLGSRRIKGDEAPRLLIDTPAPYLYRTDWNKLTIVVQGSRFEIFVDDWYVESFTDSTYTSGTFVIWAQHCTAAIDYVRIYATP